MDSPSLPRRTASLNRIAEICSHPPQTGQSGEEIFSISAVVEIAGVRVR